jgi:rRNA maturation endonuclease Nob1
MPKGYPDTITCKNCKEGLPGDEAFQFCPYCGQPLFEKKKAVTNDTESYEVFQKSKGDPRQWL